MNCTHCSVELPDNFGKDWLYFCPKCGKRNWHFCARCMAQGAVINIPAGLDHCPTCGGDVRTIARRELWKARIVIAILAPVLIVCIVLSVVLLPDVVGPSCEAIVRIKESPRAGWGVIGGGLAYIALMAGLTKIFLSEVIRARLIRRFVLT